MRLSSRIATAAGLLVALLLGVLFYNLSLLRGLAIEQQNLLDAELEATTLSLEQRRWLARLDEFTRKLFVTRDPAYAERLQEIELRLDGLAAALGRLELSPPVDAATAALIRSWSRFPLGVLAGQVFEHEPGSAGEELLLAVFGEHSERLRQQAEAVTAAAQAAVDGRAAAALEASERARTVSGMVVVAALVLSLPLLVLAVASVREPVSRLYEGIRSVAAGELAFRLDDSRDGEFSGLLSSFNQMVRRLGERERVQQDLISHLSHELKTPLVAMEETNRLLLDGIPGELNPRQRRLLELHLEGSRRLSSMVGKLLELVRLEAGGVELDLGLHDLGELACAAAERFAASARQRGVGIDFAPPPEPVTARCDRDRIGQILDNLVENALKFSAAGGSVRLRVARQDSPESDGGGETAPVALVEVSDCGPGVAEEDRERIFERFRQSSSRRGGGVGLGLAICRELAAAHGGRVWVEPGDGGGSVFSLALPSLPAVPTAVDARGGA